MADPATDEAAARFIKCLIGYQHQMATSRMKPEDFQRVIPVKCTTERTAFKVAATVYFANLGSTDSFAVTKIISDQIAKLEAMAIGDYTEAYDRLRH